MLCIGTKSEMAHMRAQWLPNPYHLGGPQCSAKGQHHKWPTCGHGGYLTPAISGVPKKRGETIRSDYLTLAFAGAQKRAELLPNPCILGDPQRQARGENQRWLPHPCLLGGPKVGRSATQPLYSRRSRTPSAGRKSEVATSPLPSRGAKSGRKCYATPLFSGIPKATRGEKIRSGYLTDAFSGAQKRAELLRNPCILGDPQRQARGENQKWLPHPSLLGGPKEGGIAT